MTIAYVRFMDSVYTGVLDLREKDDLPGPREVSAAGILAVEDDKFIALALTLSEDADYRGTISIPKFAITSIERFETDEV